MNARNESKVPAPILRWALFCGVASGALACTGAISDQGKSIGGGRAAAAPAARGRSW